MLDRLPKHLEFRLLAWLGSLAIFIYLLNVLGSFIAIFSDLIIIIILSWLLAFVLDPLVMFLTKKGRSRLTAVVIIYSALLLAIAALFAFVIPATISQLTTLVGYLPGIFLNAPAWTGHLETIITGALSNYVVYAQTFASFLASLLMVAIISFYLLLSKSELEKSVLVMVPAKFRDDFLFLQKTLNTTFASFLRVQVLVGLIVGLITMVVLAVFSIDFALSTGILAGLLAMIPVVGPILSIVPPLLAASTITLQKGLITGALLFLIYQLIYNLVAPRLVGSALKIHPVFVILTFIVGYKLAGPWGAIFAVPLAVSVGIVLKELWKYWLVEAGQK